MEAKFIDSILAQRQKQPFIALSDFVFRTNVSKDVIENLILAGAFDSFTPNRRSLLWQLPNYLSNRQGSLFLLESAQEQALPDFTPWQRWMLEFEVLNLSASTHVMDFFRPRLAQRKFASSRDVKKQAEGAKVKTAGYVIRPHRPPTRSGKIVVFLTLEDEFGLLDVTVFENVYQRYGENLYQHPLLIVEGTVSSRGGKEVSLVAERIMPLLDPGDFYFCAISGVDVN